MKKIYFFYLFLILFVSKAKTNNDTLFIYYLENYPYSYTEKNEIKGIEVEIAKEFVNWLKTDGWRVTVIYKAFSEFNVFYDAVKNGNTKVIGLGSVTINKTRLNDVSFSPPYIKNVSILISNSHANTLKSKNEIVKTFKNYSAVTIKNSIYENYLKSIKKQQIPSLQIDYVDNEFAAIDSVAKNQNVFAYCDILSYWTYVEKHNHSLTKIQKVFTIDKDNLGLIIPKKSIYTYSMSEFFESGFGFIASKKYNQILEKYLSFEVIESVRFN